MFQNVVPPELSRVLIIALGTMGEVLNNISAMDAIRNYHKNAHIFLIIDPINRRLFENFPAIDEIVTNFKASNMREDISLATSLQKARFDMVYDLSSNDESAVLYKKFWPSKPKWSGTSEGCSHPYVDRGREKLHPLDRAFEQIWLCGIGPKEGYAPGTAPLPDLSYIIPEKERANYAPPALGVNYEYALLIPESGGKIEDAWPASKYVELAKLLQDQGLRPIICGTNDAIVLGNEIRAGVPEILDLVGRLDIWSFVSLAQNANLVIGTNCDLSVLAAFANAPMVALINPNSSNLRKSAPRGNRTITLVAKDFAQIAPTQIMQTARSILKN